MDAEVARACRHIVALLALPALADVVAGEQVIPEHVLSRGHVAASVALETPQIQVCRLHVSEQGGLSWRGEAALWTPEGKDLYGDLFSDCSGLTLICSAKKHLLRSNIPQLWGG